MNIHQIVQGFVASFLVAIVFGGTSVAARTSGLRYQFVEGQTNVYHVRIETRGETGRDTLSGNIFVVAKNVSSNSFRLTLRGNLTPRREPNNTPYFGSPSRMPMNFSFQEGTEIQMDDRGRVLRVGSDLPLPIPLGQLTRLLFEILPEKGPRWELTDDTFVLDDPQNTGPVDAYMSSRFGMHYFGPNQGPALLAVKRQVKFEITKTSGDEVSIRKQIRLESWLRTGDEPRSAATGEGVLIFDSNKGLFRQIDLECESSGKTENIVRKTSCTLQVRLLEGAELEKTLNPPPPAPPVTRVLTTGEFEKLLSDLSLEDYSARHAAATKLSTSKVDEIPAASMEILAARLSDTDSWMRQSVTKFISNNGTKEAVPLLIKLLKDSDYSVRQPALKGLSRIQDPRAAEPLVEIIARGQSDVQEATSALTKIGSEAEPAALNLLQEKNVETRRRACALLGQIGTAKSVEPLKNIMTDPDQSLSQAAGDALRSVQIRL